MTTNDLAAISRCLAEFARERDWEKFHSPKNLAISVSVEAAELLEHFQWVTEEESLRLTDPQVAELAEEVADVQIYLLMLANKLGIDLCASVRAKIDKNRAKYPVDADSGAAEEPCGSK